MIIDFHTHIFPPRIKKNRDRYVARDHNFASLYSSPKAKLATADELIASMDKDGVDIAVALNINWSAHELCVETNDYILESVARYPRRLIGFGAIPAHSPEAALAEIERCVKGGIRGIGEMREVPGKPIIEAIIRHGLVLLMHGSEPVGHHYPGKGEATPELLYPLITSYPDLMLVCAHWGGGLPFYALMPEVKRAMGNVFFDTAASPLLYSPQVYHQVSQLVGADRILFGSDYPLLKQSRSLRELRSLDLPEATERLILSGNARRLLRIEE